MGNERALDFIYHATKAHWLHWRCDYEHLADDWENKPAVLCRERLGRFCSEFGVRRQIYGKGDNHPNWQNFTGHLVTRMGPVLIDPTGAALEELSIHLDIHALTVGGERTNGVRPTSLLSKIAMLLKPAIFMPIDDWAEKGLLRLGERSAARHGYTGFVSAANGLWQNSVHGQAIKTYLDCYSVGGDGIEKKPGFDRRMFDTYLMACGGRFGQENNPSLK